MTATLSLAELHKLAMRAWLDLQIEKRLGHPPSADELEVFHQEYIDFLEQRGEAAPVCECPVEAPRGCVGLCPHWREVRRKAFSDSTVGQMLSESGLSTLLGRC